MLIHGRGIGSRTPQQTNHTACAGRCDCAYGHGKLQIRVVPPYLSARTRSSLPLHTKHKTKFLGVYPLSRNSHYCRNTTNLPVRVLGCMRVLCVHRSRLLGRSSSFRDRRHGAEKDSSELGSLPSVKRTSLQARTSHLSGAHDGGHESPSSPGSERPVLVVHYDLCFVHGDGE